MKTKLFLILFLSYVSVTYGVTTYLKVHVHNNTLADQTVRITHTYAFESQETIGPQTISAGDTYTFDLTFTNDAEDDDGHFGNFFGPCNLDVLLNTQAIGNTIFQGGDETWHTLRNVQQSENPTEAEFSADTGGANPWFLPRISEDEELGGTGTNGEGQLNLKNQVFREGVDRITTAITNSGGGGGGGGGVTTQSEALALQQNTLFATSEATESPTLASMAASGNSAASDLAALWGSVPTERGYSVDPGDGPNIAGAGILAIQMPAAFGGAIVDFNPFTETRLGPLASWFRTATEWLVALLFAGWMFQQFYDWMKASAATRQATGNPIAAGSGAQATALLMAGVITVAVLVGATALFAWGFDSLDVSGMIGHMTENPLATIPTGIVWMLDQVLPVDFLLSVFVAKIAFSMLAGKLFAIMAAVVRWAIA